MIDLNQLHFSVHVQESGSNVRMPLRRNSYSMDRYGYSCFTNKIFMYSFLTTAWSSRFSPSSSCDSKSAFYGASSTYRYLEFVW